MNWLQKFFTSRYLKSGIRYLLAALTVYLNKDVNIEFLDQLIVFLEEHSDRLADVLTAVLIGWLGTWTTLKNRENSKAEKRGKTKVL